MRSYGGKWRAAAKWLGIITVGVLAVADSAGSVGFARALHEHTDGLPRDTVGNEQGGAFNHRDVRRNCAEMSIATLGAIIGRAAVRVTARGNSFVTRVCVCGHFIQANPVPGLPPLPAARGSQGMLNQYIGNPG